MLRVESLTTRHGSIAALRAATLHVEAGEIVGVIGPNDAGKTTLLNSVAGLLNPAAGRVLLDDRDVSGAPPDRMLSGPRRSAGAAVVRVSRGRVARWRRTSGGLCRGLLRARPAAV